jgi:hypothetical protein
MVENTGLFDTRGEHGHFLRFRGGLRVTSTLELILRLVVVKVQVQEGAVYILQGLLSFLVCRASIVLKELPSGLDLLVFLSVIVFLFKNCEYLFLFCRELSACLDSEPVKEVEVVVEGAAWDELADGLLAGFVSCGQDISLVGFSFRVGQICWLRLHIRLLIIY